jgi:hypothetical protein
MTVMEIGRLFIWRWPGQTISPVLQAGTFLRQKALGAGHLAV